VPIQVKIRRNEMEQLNSRTAREVLDEHLQLSNDWKDEEEMWRNFSEDLRRNFSEDCVVLTNRGVFRGHEGIRELVEIESAQMIGEEMARGGSFQYINKLVEGRMGFLEWAYEDANVRIRDGADSYLIEDGKIVAQTIHYTMEEKRS
jgi:hypothetical protein